MPSVRFGGSCGEVRDAKSGALVHPKCMGEAISDQPKPAVQAAIFHGVAVVLASASGSLISAASTPDLARIAAEATQMLGSPVEIEMLSISFSAEDLAALRG